MGREIKPHKCGWCLAGEHEKCRPEYVFEGRVYDCMCAHPVTQSEWPIDRTDAPWRTTYCGLYCAALAVTKETDMSDADPDVCYLCGNDEGDIEALIDGELTPVCARCALTLPEED